jgi:uncharacterized membrane protein YfcA
VTDAAVLVGLGLLIGLLIGLLGAGGTVLTVPGLVYLAGLPAATAVATSLVLVTLSSLAGLATHGPAGRVRWREGLAFGALGIGGAALGSRLSAAVPEPVLLGLFAVVLLAAAASMLRDRPGPRLGVRAKPWPQVILLATVVGLLTGFFGVGGGFLVVPALVVALGMPLAEATATALVVIAVNAAVALVARGGEGVDLAVTGWTGAGAVAGAALGARLAGRLPTTALRRAFGVLLVLVAVLVVAEARL